MLFYNVTAASILLQRRSILLRRLDLQAVPTIAHGIVRAPWQVACNRAPSEANFGNGAEDDAILLEKPHAAALCHRHVTVTYALRNRHVTVT